MITARPVGQRAALDGCLFGAALGGADAITIWPHDLLRAHCALRSDGGSPATPRPCSRRSRTSPVVDPAGGSWYVEALTDELARTAGRRSSASRPTAASWPPCATDRARCAGAGARAPVAAAVAPPAPPAPAWRIPRHRRGTAGARPDAATRHRSDAVPAARAAPPLRRLRGARGRADAGGAAGDRPDRLPRDARLARRRSLPAPPSPRTCSKRAAVAGPVRRRAATASTRRSRRSSALLVGTPSTASTVSAAAQLRAAGAARVYVAGVGASDLSRRRRGGRRWAAMCSRADPRARAAGRHHDEDPRSLAFPLDADVASPRGGDRGEWRAADAETGKPPTS